MAAHFHTLAVKRITPDAAGSAAITLQVPAALRDGFDFRPGQFLTLRATIDGQDTRRSYSICSPRQRYLQTGEIDIGVKPVEGGTFSRWALAQLRAGDAIEVLPPDGRFTPRIAGARHRVGFAAGSGVTPVLSIMASTLAAEPQSRFTLVYGNQRISTIMFSEVLQDLKDRYPARVSLIHLLSRQPQELDLLNGRIDAAKIGELLRGILPARDIDEAFICGPEGMIEETQRALLAGGVPAERIHFERFIPAAPTTTTKAAPRPVSASAAGEPPARHRLEVVLDGKTHQLAMGDDDRVLDTALEAGLDLPYSCKSGVCCTCRARVLEGKVQMEKNFTLEDWEIAKGFVLTCQSRPLTDRVVVSYDER
ncbi:MAG TPA: 2Fe-2S iron-sulfur cluster-binding protein [Ramlibacter sp.]|nr:2Fe-2S iron-sulfur cluster-binding protein [Ramlibacter sp.]